MKERFIKAKVPVAKGRAIKTIKELEKAIKDIKLPAIVVADGRLGSINRAILTCEYAKMHGIEVKAIIVNDTTAVDPFLLKTNVEDMERYTGIPVVAVVPPYQGPDIQKVQLGWGRSFVDSKKVWHTVLGL